MSGTNVLYPCETATDDRRVVASTLFQSMRWMFWYEMAVRLSLRDIADGRTS